MHLSRRLAIAALLSAAPLLAACAKDPIGNTDNHVSVGPPLPEVHPTVRPVPVASTTPAPSPSPSASSSSASPTDSATTSAAASPSAS